MFKDAGDPILGSPSISRDGQPASHRVRHRICRRRGSGSGSGGRRGSLRGGGGWGSPCRGGLRGSRRNPCGSRSPLLGRSWGPLWGRRRGGCVTTATAIIEPPATVDHARRFRSEEVEQTAGKVQPTPRAAHTLETRQSAVAVTSTKAVYTSSMIVA